MNPFFVCVKFFWFFLLFPLLGFSQQPSHYIIGEEELGGVDVYSILHASDKNYYLGTSNGLIVYDGYDFTSIVCEGALTSSVFNLVEDYEGNVYYNNLGGQVFKVKNGNCKLQYTIPDSLSSADIGIEVDNLNRLVVRVAGIIFLDDSGDPQDIYRLGYTGHPNRMSDSSLWFYSEAEERFVAFKSGKRFNKKEFKDDNVQTPIYSAFEFGGRRFRYTLNSCKLFENDSLLINPEQFIQGKQSNRLYPTENSIWLAPNSAGVYQFNEQLELLNKDRPYFPKTLISAICQDNEGNILLGTFGNGLIVIPNEKTFDFVLPDEGEKVISIDKSPDGTLYFGTISGRIYAKNDDVRLFREREAKRMESLFVGNNHLVIGDLNGTLIDRESGIEKNLAVGSIKDVAFVGKDSALIGSNVGAFWLNLATSEASRVAELKLRHTSIGYDSKTRSVYSGTAKGLAIVDSLNKVRFVELNGNPIGARSIISWRDKMYVATIQNGILVFKNDTIYNHWNTGSGLISDRLLQLKAYEDKILVSSDNGVQLLDEGGETLQIIQGADGLASDHVSDFELIDQELWAVTPKGVQQIDLKELDRSTFTPELKIQSLVVNDSSINDLSLTNFKSDQQNLSFELKVSSLKHQPQITYAYKLDGAESEWQTAPYSNHIIRYQSLSPGDYTFRAKAVCRDKESQEITYSFTIATPFYMAWWFYALISLGLILLLSLWFRRRLKRQAFLAKQQNELNASKLTAIQSQMNPHFIFNALNSIQDLVLKGDVPNSYTYITKFADLVRRTLNYSDKDFIDFENELKLIELYLTLEKLRFKTNFEYQIDATGIEDVQIPPMLIQPFIENALVHGLLHKEGDRVLQLSFELGKNLVCTVTDNGVGRTKAKEIKERQRSSHESFSVNAIKRRFEILKRNFGGELGFTTEDLVENGKAIGTCVKLIIPVKHKF